MGLVYFRWGKGFTASKILVTFYHYHPMFLWKNHVSEYLEMFLTPLSMTDTNSSPFHASLIMLM